MGIGFDGYVVSKINRYKKLGAFAYLIGAMAGMLSFKNFDVRISINTEVIEIKSLMVLVGMCRYAGGGMRLTESPNPFDGLFDISIAGNLKTSDILRNLGHLFNGKIVNHKKVRTFKSKSIQIEVPNKGVYYLQADGELINGRSISVSLIPEKFSFYAP